MADIVHRFNYRIHEADLDFLGHVNNARYLEILEKARWDWIEKGGYGYDRMKQEQKGPVILEVVLKFKKELTLHTDVVIETFLPTLERLTSSVTQHILSPDGATLYTTLDLKVGFFDLKTRRLIPPTADWLKAINLS